MAETLLSPSGILLYGRVLEDVTFQFVDPHTRGRAAPADPPPRLGGNKFLQAQLAAGRDGEPDPNLVARLARVYGFSYEGHYYDLPKPAIFLVHGDGADPPDLRHDPEGPRPDDARVSRAPADVDRTGVALTDSSFSEDMRVWAYDKGDFSIRMDVETGPFEQILLEAVLRPDQLQSYYGGADLRGADLRMRGADLRVSGADLRLRRGRSD